MKVVQTVESNCLGSESVSAVRYDRTAKPRYYHPELDCLRFFAFAAVFCDHSVQPHIKNLSVMHKGPFTSALAALFDSSRLGVDLFFCLSSFLITSLLLREWVYTDRIDVRSFWIRRILRIWPLYFFFVGLTVCVFSWALPEGPLQNYYTIAFIFFVGNFTFGIWGYPTSVITPLWSVSFEEQFYLLWPLLLKILSPRRIVPVAIVCLVIASVARIVFLSFGLKHQAEILWTNTFVRLDPIALGAICAVVARRIAWNPSRLTRISLLAAGVILPPLLEFYLGSEIVSTSWSLLFYPAATISCAAIIAGIYHEEEIRCPRWLVYLGRISYGLYVFHTLCLELMRIALAKAGLTHETEFTKLWINICIFVGGALLTLMMAALSYRYLESPFLMLKKRFTIVPSV